MEIFQTIWISLTSENPGLINLLNIPLCIIEITISMLLFSTLLNLSTSKKNKLIYIILLSVVGVLNVLFIPSPYNTFINIFMGILATKILFKTTILKAILSQILPLIIFVLIGSIFLNMLPAILHLSSTSFINIPIYKLMCSSLLYLFAFFIYYICKTCNFNIFEISSFKKKNNLILIANFVIGIISICIQSYLATLYSDIIPIYATFANILSILIYFVISIYSLSRTSKLEVTKQNLEEAKLYNKTLTILHDNIRGFKHDFNNIVQAIGGYVATDDMEGLKKYYSDLLVDCQKVTNLSTLNPQVINSPPIFSILTDKYHKADEKGIKINLEIFLDLNTLNMKMYEFTRMLGILLDNAIEAAKECDEKIINIQMRKDSKVNRQLVIIENTYSNKDINIDKIFEKSYTTKPNNTGLGLWEVRQILKKSNNLNLFTTKDNKFFKQQLEIYL